MALDYRKLTGKKWLNFINSFIVLGILIGFLVIGKYGETHSKMDNPTGLKDPLFGIFTLLCLSVTFLIMNAISTIPYFENIMKAKEDEKRRNHAGVLLMLGASAIVFGFLDNYGMKLGTDALENGVFDKMGDVFMKPPANVKVTPGLQERIDDAKGGVGNMLGNTFSDFVGAMLGAGFGKLFEHLTSVSGDVQGDIGFVILQNPVMKVLLESIFIALGCLIPVLMEFRSKRKKLYGKKDSKGLITGFLAFIGIIVAALVIIASLPIPDGASVNETGASVTSMVTSALGVLVMIGLSVMLFKVFRKTMPKTSTETDLKTLMEGRQLQTAAL